MKRIKILIASPSDKENLVAELWSDNCQFAELSQEEGNLSLEIYSNPGGNWWSFSFDEVLEAFEQAKFKLKGSQCDHL